MKQSQQTYRMQTRLNGQTISERRISDAELQAAIDVIAPIQSAQLACAVREFGSGSINGLSAGTRFHFIKEK